MTADLFKEKLLIFITGSLPADKKTLKIKTDTELFATGMIDSMRIIDLIAFVEKTLDIVIKDENISMEFFGSVDKIAASFIQDHEKKR